MQKKQLLLYVYSAVIFTSSSCESGISKQQVEEGTISYTISYPDIPKNSHLLGIMPSQMTTSFTKKGFRSDIEAGMGLFKTSIISNKNNDKLIHSVKIINEKYASNLDSEDISKISPQFNQINFEITNKTKEIAGYDCQEIIATLPKEDSSWTFKLYYTDKIQVPNPNRLTPFASIKGVLMEYEAINYDTRMHFIANKVSQTAVDARKLDLESEYKIVSSDTIQAKIMSMFSLLQ